MPTFLYWFAGFIAVIVLLSIYSVREVKKRMKGRVAILEIIENGQPMSAQELRARLNREYGLNFSLVVFYQLMMKFEDAGYVEAWYEEIPIRENIAKMRHFRITEEGRTNLKLLQITATTSR